MCGHVGVFGTITPKILGLFEDLINMDVVRGMDGTGIGFVSADFKHSVLKKPWLPYQLMRHRDYVEAVSHKNILLMGHNRAATRGWLNEDHTHPFQMDHITLCHNGTLRGQHRLPDEKDYFNDSENIAHSVRKLGIAETWKIIEGAAALVFWDNNLKTLNFIRNEERPFHFTYINSGQTLVWSSDNKLLEEAMTKRDIKCAGKSEVWSATSHTLYSFSMDKRGKLVQAANVKLDKYEYKYVNQHVNQGHFSRADGVVERWVWRNGERVLVPESDMTPTDAMAHNVKGTTLIPFSSHKSSAPRGMAYKEFHEHYKACCFCGSSLEHEYLSCTVIDEKSASCEDCATTGHQAGITLRA